jgi:hypothetical protein
MTTNVFSDGSRGCAPVCWIPSCATLRTYVSCLVALHSNNTLITCYRISSRHFFFKSSHGGHVVLATHAVCFSQLPCLFFWQQPVGCSRHAQWCCVVFRVSSRLRQEVSCFAGSLHPVSLGTCRFVLSDSWKRILGQHVVFASFIFFASPLSVCPRLRLHARSNCVFATFLLSYSAT